MQNTKQSMNQYIDANWVFLNEAVKIVGGNRKKPYTAAWISQLVEAGIVARVGNPKQYLYSRIDLEKYKAVDKTPKRVNGKFAKK